jgi:26S proteasome regulatory subunit N10
MTLMGSDPRAVAVLIDNTHSSMDGDFYPTRLEAQKNTVERLAQYLFTLQPSSQLAIGTLCSSECGIRSSFTSCQLRISNSLRPVTSRCGVAQLSLGIHWSILAFHHCNQNISLKRILAFVGGDHDILDEAIAVNLADQLLKEKVYIDIVVIGLDVPGVKLLKKLIPTEVESKCHFLEVPNSDTVLSDNVLASPIGSGEESARVPLGDGAISDTDVPLSNCWHPPGYDSESLETTLHAEPVPSGNRKGRPPARRPQARNQKGKGKEPDKKDKVT